MRKNIFILMILVGVMAIVMVSCGKKESAPAEENSSVQPAEQPGEEEITQTVCPVMSNKINKDIWVEHNGNKIYFCCAGCPEEFKKDPEKYMKKLNEEITDPGIGNVKKVEIHYCNS